jgi:hypothetical protein
VKSEGKTIVVSRGKSRVVVFVLVLALLGAVLALRHEQSPTSSAIQAINNGLYGAPHCSVWDRIWANNGCGF